MPKIAKSILAVDTLTIQRSLTVLEDRYRELREMGEKHLHALEADVAKEKAEREALPLLAAGQA